MSEKEKVPTFEEFKETVKKMFADGWTTLSKSEVNDYINSVEAMREIRGEYNSSLKDYNDGKITLRVFRVGCAASVANLLIYMY